MALNLFAFNLAAQSIVLKRVRAPSETEARSNQFSFEQTDKWQNVGYFGSGIRPYLKKNPEAARQLRLFTNKRIIMPTLCLGGVLAAVIIPIKILNGLDRDAGIEEKTPAFIWMFGGIAVAGTAYLLIDPMARSSNKNLVRAVEIYNQGAPYSSVPKQTRDVHYGLKIGASSSGPMSVGLVAGF